MPMTQKELPATPRKRDKARRDGNICKGSILSSALSLSVGIYASFWLFRDGWLAPGMLVKLWYFGDLANSLTLYRQGLVWAFLAVMFCLVPCGLVTICIEIAQLGFRIFLGSGFRIQGRLSIVNGFKSLVSRVSQLWIQLLTLAIFVTVLSWFYIVALMQWVLSGFANPASLVRSMGCLVGALVVVGALDFWIRRWRYISSLRMTREEMKQEAKESEGDPHVRSHRKALHRALVMQTLEARVRNSRVLIVERSRPRMDHR